MLQIKNAEYEELKEVRVIIKVQMTRGEDVCGRYGWTQKQGQD